MKIKKILISITLAAICATTNLQQVHADSTKTITAQEVVNSTTDTKDNAKNDTKNTNKPITNSGWKTKNNKRVYYKNNKLVKGLHKIQGSWYLFDKNGYMLTGVRKIPHQSSYGYFDKNGKRKLTNTNTKKAHYWIQKNGKIVGIKNNAKAISQLPEMPTGCEITAVTMMLNFAGKKVSKEQAAKIMPRSLNPNKGFIGSPYKKFPLGFWVAPGGVEPVVKHYLGKAKIMTNCSMNSIHLKLLRSHLVVVWVGWFDNFSNHALTLTGYHKNTLYYNDPWTGTKRAMKASTFKKHWVQDGHRAISY